MTTDFIFGTTSGCSTGFAMRLFLDKLQKGEDFVVFDPKASIHLVSRNKAKKRLMASGLSPSKANALVRDFAGRPFQGAALRSAMRHHSRRGSKWFPWDTFIG
jgi:hypothetical protein